MKTPMHRRMQSKCETCMKQDILQATADTKLEAIKLSDLIQSQKADTELGVQLS